MQPVKIIVNTLLNGYIIPPILRPILLLVYQITCEDGFAGILCDAILQYALGGAPGTLIDVLYLFTNLTFEILSENLKK